MPNSEKSSSDNLCSPAELQAILHQGAVRVLDCSWYLPSQQINTYQAYLDKHIPGAGFFHIDLVCDQQSDLPHMLPTPQEFANEVGKLGISNESEVVVYDSAGLFSAARVWWMFRVFGHSKVRVLDGGLPAWIEFGGELSSNKGEQKNGDDSPAVFKPRFNQAAVVSKAQLIANCDSKDFLVLDARSNDRFLGLAPEPRPGLPSGHMPQSVSLPFNRLLHNGKMKLRHELHQLFMDSGVSEKTQVVTSCGSGVTAAIITLALSESGFGLQRLYDGSWAEWGSANDTIILTSDGIKKVK